MMWTAMVPATPGAFEDDDGRQRRLLDHGEELLRRGWQPRPVDEPGVEHEETSFFCRDKMLDAFIGEQKESNMSTK